MIVWAGPDPERVSEHHFGGPHFMVGERRGDKVFAKGKVWSIDEIAAAVREQRNIIGRRAA